MNTITFRGKTINYNFRPEFWEHLDGWESETFDVMDRFLGEGKTFADIGAWNGVLSLYAHLLGCSKILAVEPDPVAYEEASEVFHLNGIIPSDHGNSKFVFSKIAVGGDRFELKFREDATSEAPWSYSPHIRMYNSKDGFGNSMSSILQRENRSEEYKDVVCYPLSTTIGSWGNFNIDLIKIDTEGAELEIVHGGTFKRFMEYIKCPPLLLSLHPYWYAGAQDADKIMDILYDTGYNQFKTEYLPNHQLLLLS